MRPRLQLIVVTVPLATLVAMSLPSCSESVEPTSLIMDKRLPLVGVATLDWHRVRHSIATTAYLESEHRVTIFSKIAGRVLTVSVDEGQPVSKGQELAHLDDREAQQAIKQVEVQLVERNTRKKLAELGVEIAARKFEQAKIDRNKALAEYQRNTSIDPDLIAPKELDDSKFNWEASEESVKVAEFDVRSARLEVDVAVSSINELKAALEQERLRLAEHVIRSPIDGIVEDLEIHGGETIGTASELFFIVDGQNLISYLRRPQRELAVIQGAKEVRFTTDAWPGKNFTANIEVLSPVVDHTSGSFRLRIRIRKEDTEILRPGMFIRATILTEEEREALMVPKAAVVNEIDKSIVYVIRDMIAHRIILDPGLEQSEFIECKNLGDHGLGPGDLVVVSGQRDLRDKAEVEISKN